jgi:hypothetical protein
MADAGTLAPTTVTIKAQNGDFSGVVKSTRPLVCANGRNVIVFKQVGPQQNPRVDVRVGSDTASLNGDRYEWSTGNSGVFGKVYSLVRRTPDCRPDTSKTVRSVRSP